MLHRPAPRRACSTALVLCALALPALPAAAAPRCSLSGAPWIEGRLADSAAAPGRAVDARRGEAIDAFLVVPGRLDGKAVLFSDDGGRGRVSYAGAGCGTLRVSWRRVEPRPEHTATPPPNRDLRVYANAQVFGPHHGRWIGFDRVEYFETPLPDAGDAPRLRLREALPSAPGAAPRLPAHQGLGTLRLCATVTAEPGGAPLSTPGAADAPAGLIAERVFRFSFRQGDGFLGWLTSFYNVPYLFGSAGEGAKSQAERRLGADCADVLTAALRLAGRRDLRYTNVGGLIDALGPVGPIGEVPTPAGAAPLRMAKAPQAADADLLRPGDILAVDYVNSAELPRSWDHIVVLIEDRGPDGAPDGVLGPEDLVADSGDALALKVSPLREQGHVRVRAARPRGVPIGPMLPPRPPS